MKSKLPTINGKVRYRNEGAGAGQWSTFAGGIRGSKTDFVPSTKGIYEDGRGRTKGNPNGTKGRRKGEQLKKAFHPFL